MTMPNMNILRDSITLISHIIATMNQLQVEDDYGLCLSERDNLSHSIEELFQRGTAETIMLDLLIPNYLHMGWQHEILDVAEEKGHTEILDALFDLGLWEPTPHSIDILLGFIVIEVEYNVTEKQLNNYRKTCLWYVTRGFLLLGDLPPELGLN